MSAPRRTAGGRHPSNADIASLLERIATLLEAKEENPFRVRSYRAAAEGVRASRKRLAQVALAGGAEGLREVKGVGEKLAGLILEFVQSGKVELLDDLAKEAAEGPGASAEAAPPKRVEAPARPKPPKASVALDVATVLEVDAEYREKAKAGKLKMIAPRRFNPEGKAWLPLLVREHRGYRFTVMFSNTARAHELGKTDDWVVVYYEKGAGEDQCTVVTESRGPLKGKRVIRGREKECGEHYARA